jgi:formylglycine-generating enzyme required for sulfatase activity
MPRWLHHAAVAVFLAAVLFLAMAADAPRLTDFQAYTQTIPGSKVSFSMVPIPAGDFLMGSPIDEVGRNPDEGPQHPVGLHAFWIGKTEVTWDEYDLFWKTEPGAQRPPPQSPADREADAVTRPTAPYADETFGHGREHHPVLGITHHAAMQYCHWLSLKTGRIYRLPAEAEWEYACRAGIRTAYYFGNDAKALGDYGWYAANSEDVTHEVGQKRPNPWGVYDMYGNVAEWCLDQYRADFYASLSADRLTFAPVVVPTANRFAHVVRGGSWADDAAHCRSAVRRASDKRWLRRDPQRPQSIWWLTDGDFVGFRVVRPVVEQDNLKDLKSRVTPDSP